MKEKIKNMKGITLVALIITIIVLLILAVVAITSINNNKILEYAKNGRDSYNQKATNEKDKMNEYEQYLDANNPSKSNSGNKERTFYLLSDSIIAYIFKENNVVDAILYDENGGENEAESRSGTYSEKNGEIIIGEDSIFKETIFSIGKNNYKGLVMDWGPILFEEIPVVNENFVGNTYKLNDMQYFTFSLSSIKGTNIKALYLHDRDNTGKNTVFFDGNDMYEMERNDEGTVMFVKKGTFSEDGETYTEYGETEDYVYTKQSN